MWSACERWARFALPRALTNVPSCIAGRVPTIVNYVTLPLSLSLILSPTLSLLIRCRDINVVKRDLKQC